MIFDQDKCLHEVTCSLASGDEIGVVVYWPIGKDIRSEQVRYQKITFWDSVTRSCHNIAESRYAYNMITSSPHQGNVAQ